MTAWSRSLSTPGPTEQEINFYGVKRLRFRRFNLIIATLLTLTNVLSYSHFKFNTLKTPFIIFPFSPMPVTFMTRSMLEKKKQTKTPVFLSVFLFAV